MDYSLGDILLALLPFYVPLVYLAVFNSAKKNGYMSEIEQKYRDRQEEIELEFPRDEAIRLARNQYASSEYMDLWIPIIIKRVAF